MKRKTKKKVKKINIDILNNRIEPQETDIKPLKSELNKLRGILKKELLNNGFELNFVKKAIMKFEIPIDDPRFKNTVYCYPYIEDENGKIYKPKKRIIETSWQEKFNPSLKKNFKIERVKKNWIEKIKKLLN